MFSEKTTGIPAYRSRGGLMPSPEVFAAFAKDAYLNGRLAAKGSTKLESGPVQLAEGILESWHRRDQHDTNTCVAFATVACLELLRSRGEADGLERLSPQFIYWHMRKTYPLTEDLPPDYHFGATRISQARDVILKNGVCSEDLYPFALTIDDVGPSDKASEDASSRIHEVADYGIFKKYEDIVPGTAWKFVEFLQAGRPVVAGVPVFHTRDGVDNFHTVDTYRTGVVLGPTDSPSTAIVNGHLESSGHVVCLVGFQPDPDEAMGGWFVFRNSWGVSFARQPDTARGVPAPGYGVISASYVDAFCWEYCCPKTV